MTTMVSFEQTFCDSSRLPAVVALIPAHNEEDLVEQSLRSLLTQSSVNLIKVILVADNCTDNTLQIARRLEGEFPNLEVIESRQNQSGKSGAMNQAFRHLQYSGVKYVLQMDADTILNEDALVRAIKDLESDDNLGGVCARFRIIPPENEGFVRKLLWRLQNIEYGLRDVQTIQSFGKDTSLLSGRASVLRLEALVKILEIRGYIWDVQSEVEDHELTLALKKIGWKTAVSMKMLAATSIPESMGELLKQRVRWYRGTIRLLKQEKFSKHTRKDTLSLLSLFFWLPIRVSFLVWIALLIAGIADYQFNLIFAGLTIVLWLIQMAKLQYVPDRDKWQTIFAASLVPYELYATMRDLILLASSVLGFLPSNQSKRN